MNINLNSAEYQEKERKAIFNKGEAGVARECNLTIKQKGPDDSTNAPKYKLIFTQDDGAEINRGLFELKPDASPGSIGFFAREMNHLQGQLGFKITEGVQDANEILKLVAKGVHENAVGKKFGVAVCYGTAARPKSFLEVDGFWGYRTEDNITVEKPLILSKNACQIRIEPTNNNPVPTANNISGFDTPVKPTTDDLPF